jgi:hypothetical protein
MVLMSEWKGNSFGSISNRSYSLVDIVYESVTIQTGNLHGLRNPGNLLLHFIMLKIG